MGYGEAGSAITDLPRVRKVAFTGGLETGRPVGSTADEGVKPVTLELGGKSSNIVFSAADLENAITGAIKGIFAATGQTCVLGSRLFLQQDIADTFLDRLVVRTEALAMGDPFDDDSEIAPVAHERQSEKVRAMVEAARREGVIGLSFRELDEVVVEFRLGVSLRQPVKIEFHGDRLGVHHRESKDSLGELGVPATLLARVFLRMTGFALAALQRSPSKGPKRPDRLP